MPTTRRSWMAAAAAMFAAAAAAPGSGDRPKARRRALLIGPSEYAGHPQFRLQAPPHDVMAVRAALLQHGFEEIDLLADRLPDVARPTRENIVQALERHAEAATNGELFFLYFTGHGAQQPAKSTDAGEESDGLDESLLATDVGRWRTAENTIDNAVVDDEIGAFVARCRQRGAFVWCVIDSCHSGDAIRAPVPEGAKERGIPAALFGLPESISRLVAGRRSSLRTSLRCYPGDAGLPGAVLAFFASRSDSRTIELPFPSGKADAQYAGLFTHVLLDALRGLDSVEQATYKDLIARIRRTYTQDWRDWEPQFCADPVERVLATRIFG